MAAHSPIRGTQLQCTGLFMQLANRNVSAMRFQVGMLTCFPRPSHGWAQPQFRHASLQLCSMMFGVMPLPKTHSRVGVLRVPDVGSSPAVLKLLVLADVVPAASWGDPPLRGGTVVEPGGLQQAASRKEWPRSWWRCDACSALVDPSG